MFDKNQYASPVIWNGRTKLYTPQKSLATLDGEIVGPEDAVRFEMRGALKVHGAQT